MKPEDTPEVISESSPVSGQLPKAGFKPSPTHRELKIRLWARAELPPTSAMTKEHVERVVSAKIPDSLWEKGQFRSWLLQHPEIEWQERVEYLNQLLLDRLEVTILHGDDKHIVNLAKSLPELGNKIKRAADKIAAKDELSQLTEEQLLQLIAKSTGGGKE
jgi:hypothetical protein